MRTVIVAVLLMYCACFVYGKAVFDVKKLVHETVEDEPLVDEIHQLVESEADINEELDDNYTEGMDSSMDDESEFGKKEGRCGMYLRKCKKCYSCRYLNGKKYCGIHYCCHWAMYYYNCHGK